VREPSAEWSRAGGGDGRGDGLVVDSRRLGPPLIFDRLGRETGCQAVIKGLNLPRLGVRPFLRTRKMP